MDWQQAEVRDYMLLSAAFYAEMVHDDEVCSHACPELALHAQHVTAGCAFSVRAQAVQWSRFRRPSASRLVWTLPYIGLDDWLQREAVVARRWGRRRDVR